MGTSADDKYGQSADFRPAIAELQEEGKCPKDTVHRQVKHLNNIVEADHGKLKRLINPVRGFKSMKTAYATIQGLELMHLSFFEHIHAWKYSQGLIGKIRLFEKQFNVYSDN